MSKTVLKHQKYVYIYGEYVPMNQHQDFIIEAKFSLTKLH